jgi:hypothetical protein
MAVKFCKGVLSLQLSVLSEVKREADSLIAEFADAVLLLLTLPTTEN